MSAERPYERDAADVVGRIAGRTLRRFSAVFAGDESLDYIDELDDVYEVKRVTVEESIALDQFRARSHSRATLALRWSVLVVAPTMYDKFRPMPDHAEDDKELIALLEADGATKVTRKADRETEWEAQFSGKWIEVPWLGPEVIDELEQQFLLLEEAGIRNTREDEPWTAAAAAALRAVRRLTRGSICVAHDPGPSGPGIEISVGRGYVRTGDPNMLAFRAEAWLTSEVDAAQNLRNSLKQARFQRRHAVLCFDSSEPEYWSAQESGVAFAPSREIALPAEIDVLWCIVGSVVLRYDRDDWQTSERPPQAVAAD